MEFSWHALPTCSLGLPGQSQPRESTDPPSGLDDRLSAVLLMERNRCIGAAGCPMNFRQDSRTPNPLITWPVGQPAIRARGRRQYKPIDSFDRSRIRRLAFMFVEVASVSVDSAACAAAPTVDCPFGHTATRSTVHGSNNPNRCR